MDPRFAQLLNILQCPACCASLAYETDHIICAECGKEYPVIDEIPVFVSSIEEKD